MKKISIFLIILSALLLCSCADLSPLRSTETAPKVVASGKNYKVELEGKRYKLTYLNNEGSGTSAQYFDTQPDVSETEQGYLKVDFDTAVIIYDPATGKISDDLVELIAFDDRYAVTLSYNSVTVEELWITADRYKESFTLSKVPDTAAGIRVTFAPDHKSVTVSYVAQNETETTEDVIEL